MGAPFAEVGRALDQGELVRLDLPIALVAEARLETGVVYVDSFGNLRLAGGPAELRAALGDVAPGDRLRVGLPSGTYEVTLARTFGEVEAGQLLVYVDSSGDLALGQANGSAAQALGVETGTRIDLRRA
jgi:S-adenosylmethionine hydrolase